MADVGTTPGAPKIKISACRRGPKPKKQKATVVPSDLTNTAQLCPFSDDDTLQEQLQEFWSSLYDPTVRLAENPPSLHLNSGEEISRFREGCDLSGEALLTEKWNQIAEKIIDLRRFITSEQRQQMLIDFENQVQMHASSARDNDVPTAVWDRSLKCHFMNQPFIDLVNWTHPLPSDDKLQLVHIFSPETVVFLKKNTQRSYLETTKDSVCLSAGYRRVDEEDNVYQGCNAMITVKRDVLGLPQLFIFQMIPDVS
ncbi:hypothetical protein PROFUN_15367 [Planoprotostelium fungivorum]|uniref:Uncharacterized protein n=1 Tax=Planoprotostelium fungivorum TaxID=1890364 RepID=A0A2P6MW37_9EUKA|nr:hypothetical protein PROFUN_15367 [Planoprotostelium fungivorum]